MSEWQPIETCPKDGSWLLTCNEDDGFESYEVGCHDPLTYFEFEDAGDGLFKRVEKTSYEWRGFSNIHRATHWMPLPNPPTPPEVK